MRFIPNRSVRNVEYPMFPSTLDLAEGSLHPLHLPTVLLEFPVTIIEGAHLAGLEPSRNAVEVESMLGWLATMGTGMLFESVSIQHTLQMPHATVHSSLVADAWLAWHSMPRAWVSMVPRVPERAGKTHRDP